MRRRRFPDWPIYLALVGGLLWYALTQQPRTAPAAFPPPRAAPPDVQVGPPPILPDGPALPPPSAYDEPVTVQVGEPGQGIGTAFSVDRGGTWLTARHVIDGCTRLVLVTDLGRGVDARGWIDPNADVAVVTTPGGTPGLPLETARTLRLGERAFHVGFPQGQPGEVTSQLVGRASLDVIGRGARREGLLAWAETGRSDGLKGTLGGLSGGPAFDQTGQVIGITVAESPRRGRVYTTAPESLAAALRIRVGGDRRGVEPIPPPTPANQDRLADTLRQDLRVALVACLSVS